MKVIKVIGVAGFVTTPETEEQIGKYVKSFDPEAHDGFGYLVTTSDLDEAMKFATLAEAMELYQAVPSNHPVRLTDGQPNRPLTAFHIKVAEEDVMRQDDA